MEKDLILYLKIKTMTRMTAHTTSTQYCTEGSRQCHKVEKRNKKYTDQKGRGKTVYICRPIKLLETIN